jgi:hypothetical protein
MRMEKGVSVIEKVVRGAVSAVRVVTNAGSHAAWWLDYRVRGRSSRRS